MMVRTRLTLAALCATLTAPAAFAQAPAPDIQKILNDSAGAYRTFNTFSTTFDLTRTGGPPIPPISR